MGLLTSLMTPDPNKTLYVVRSGSEIVGFVAASCNTVGGARQSSGHGLAEVAEGGRSARRLSEAFIDSQPR